MNRKLHNTVTALFATSGLLVLSLIAARPVPTQETLVEPAAVHAELRDSDVAAAERAAAAAKTKGRHAAAAAQRIEKRAADLEARLAKTKNAADAVGEIVGFAAEAATLASIAAAMDGVETGDAAIVDADTERSTNTPARKRPHGRQSVAMPFFSFAPRG